MANCMVANFTGGVIVKGQPFGIEEVGRLIVTDNARYQKVTIRLATFMYSILYIN